MNATIKRALPLVRRRAAAAPRLQRAMHGKIEIISVEAKHLSPTEFHNYLKSRNDRQELKEFLSEESEIVAMDSFNDPPSYHQEPAESSHINNKGLNEQFRKQIGNLLDPAYGSS
ncbi:hypothetical protein LPJ59_005762 [Coemansia sp. RSA 2399]|nr:hypothetical protein LPJ59_005762 [Coemansia sp. RSA 2399]KAJ1891989.1 hypothetical protein LPJ81_005637 [Coemansia sp. IMI 209127]